MLYAAEMPTYNTYKATLAQTRVDSGMGDTAASLSVEPAVLLRLLALEDAVMILVLGGLNSLVLSQRRTGSEFECNALVLATPDWIRGHASQVEIQGGRRGLFRVAKIERSKGVSY